MAGEAPDESSLDARRDGIWKLAWPSMALFALQALVGLVDFVFVSELGSGALAAVGVANQIFFFLFSVLAAVTTGTLAVVSREWGRGQPDEAARATTCSAALSGGIGIALMALIPFGEPIVGLLGAEREVAALGGECLAVLLLFSAPVSLGFAVGQALRGAGDVRTPLVIGVITNVINVAADYALIFGHWGAPALGAVGSAWASGVAFVLGTAITCALWWTGRLVIPYMRWRVSVTWQLSRRLLRVGTPTALEQTAFHGGLLIFMALVTGFGTEAIAAYLVGVRILSFCFIPGIGFSLAAGTLVGQHLGADEPDEAARAGWRGMWGAIGIMGSVGLAIVLAAHPLASLFGAAGEQTLSLTVTFIYILGAAQPLMAMEFALGGALRGAGDTRFPLFAILTGLFVFRLGAAFLVAIPYFGTVTAVWLCLLLDYSSKALLLGWRFTSGRWKEIDV